MVSCLLNIPLHNTKNYNNTGSCSEEKQAAINKTCPNLAALLIKNWVMSTKPYLNTYPMKQSYGIYTFHDTLKGEALHKYTNHKTMFQTKLVIFTKL